MKCNKCTNIHRDPVSGVTLCLTCGNVIDDCDIAANVEFDNYQNVQGTYVKFDNNNTSMTISRMFDPIQLRRNKVYNEMNKLATILQIPTTIIDRAKRLYLISYNKNFTQGRSSKILVGALLYLACRLDQSKHLLIDFSEALHVNLFVIGTIYLKLIKLLGLQVKIIDPAFYIHRFCHKLNFDKNTKDVINIAMKVITFFKRDWITTGRRPAGLCGASIYIAAKLNNIKIDINTISEVVNCSNETINTRLREFSQTKIASLSKEEFEGMSLSSSYIERDPPCFNSDDKGNDIILNEDVNILHKPMIDNKTEILSSLDNNEEEKYIYKDSEYTLRKHIWEIMNKDWIESRREKKEMLLKMKTKRIYKPRKLTLASTELSPTPFEAIRNSNKFSLKMNYNYLKNLFTDTQPIHNQE